LKTGDKTHLEAQQVDYLDKLNIVLVALAKQERAFARESFFDDICGYGQSG